jgi:hypothetical protein
MARLIANRVSTQVARAIAAAVIGLVVLSVGAAVATPALRHMASGWWNNPDGLPALPQNPQVHYEDGASEYARIVARLMPAALARVEAANGRPFAHPVTVGVYVSRANFAAANGTGGARAVGVTFLGRVMLSPVLLSTQRNRLVAILTHELCHAHMHSWMSELTYLALPNWFKEGLAVMVSGGGGAEGVSEAQAREAILDDDHFAVDDHGSLLDFISIRMAHQPVVPDTSFRIEMAYRQSGMFMAFLHDSNPAAFARLMNAILDGRPFAAAVRMSYGADLNALWDQFVRGLKNSDTTGAN